MDRKIKKFITRPDGSIDLNAARDVELYGPEIIDRPKLYNVIFEGPKGKDIRSFTAMDDIGARDKALEVAEAEGLKIVELKGIGYMNS